MGLHDEDEEKRRYRQSREHLLRLASERFGLEWARSWRNSMTDDETVTFAFEEWPDVAREVVFERAALQGSAHPEVKFMRLMERTTRICRRGMMTGKATNAFFNAVHIAAAESWKGSHPFAEQVADAILAAPNAAALEVCWRLGLMREVDGSMYDLVSLVGDRFCAIDAARARGKRMNASKSRTTARVIAVTLGGRAEAFQRLANDIIPQYALTQARWQAPPFP